MEAQRLGQTPEAFQAYSAATERLKDLSLAHGYGPTGIRKTSGYKFRRSGDPKGKGRSDPRKGGCNGGKDSGSRKGNGKGRGDPRPPPARPRDG